MFNKKKYKIIVISLIFFITSCNTKRQIFQRTFFRLDTVVTIKVISKNLSNKQFENLITTIKAKLDYYDNIFNIHNKKSEVAKVSKFMSNTSYKISSELYEVLKICKKYYKPTGGSFDPTIGSVTLLYNFTNGKTPPDYKKIKKALKYVGMNNIYLMKKNYIKIIKSPVYLDLGGIAKGYIIDKISEIIHKRGIKDFIVNIGGDIYASGKNHQGKKWRIGIQDPRNSGNIIKVVDITDKAIVTSGDYERYFIYKGKRYHHIIDPKTGYPAWSGVNSVTIIADKAVIADFLSTAIFVMGEKKGTKFLKQYFPKVRYFIANNR